jgi:Mg2+ and Co2+ transporter CorA
MSDSTPAWRAWRIEHHAVGELGTLPLDVEAGFIWIAVEREALPAHFATLQSRLAHWGGAPLLDLHVSDLLNEQLASHFDNTQAYDLMVLQRLGAGGEALQLDTRAIGFAVYANVLLSVHPTGCPVLTHFAERLPQWCATPEANRLPASSDELMLRMANHLVDSYLALRRQLSREFGLLQQALIDTQKPFRDWARLLAARDMLQRLQDLCEDQQSAVQEWLDALADWPAGEGPPEQESLRVRARDLQEHIERVLSHTRRLAASTESAVQMHYAALGHRTNNIMRVLTALTAIFLPLNLITGIFGMNFDALPLIHDSIGFWIAFGLMAAIALGLLWFFRRRRYLGSS